MKRCGLSMSGLKSARLMSREVSSRACFKSTSIKPPHRLNAQISPDVSRLIMWMLELDPAKRQEMYNEVQKIVPLADDDLRALYAYLATLAL